MNNSEVWRQDYLLNRSYPKGDSKVLVFVGDALFFWICKVVNRISLIEMDGAFTVFQA
jgi:hypothetical protein